MNLLMQIVIFALRRPISILVMILSVSLIGIFAIIKVPFDILPTLGIPVIYVSQPYGGMSPAQMEGYITSSYEYHFLYINGIKNIESKNVQGAALYKLEFYPGTNMAQAVAETVAEVNRSRNLMPPGTVPPFILRFDAGSLPVGYLVFSSKTRSIKEIQDIALYKVRPLFAALPGVSSPPPFGGNSRTIVINLDSNKLRNYNISPEDVAKAVAANHLIIPAGNIGVGDYYPLTPVNSAIDNIKEFGEIPLKVKSGTSVYLRDVGWTKDTMDILSGYALVDGKRSVYIPVTKRAGSSTWKVVHAVRKNLQSFRDAVPEDVNISYEFDQSKYVRNSLLNLLSEGFIGAVLTGLMVFLFLHSWRSTLVVIANIPLAILFSLVCLALAGKTVNIMTLGGLALSIGILVDEATVEIENIHTHLARGKSISRAVVDSAREISLPTLLALFSILAVFVPSFFMQGVPKALFVPLTLAVGFAMTGSYLLSRTLVPIIAVLLLKEEKIRQKEAEKGQKKDKKELKKVKKGQKFSIFLRIKHVFELIKKKLSKYSFSFNDFKQKYLLLLRKLFKIKKPVLIGYIIFVAIIVFVPGRIIGMELFPSAETNQFKFFLRAPSGTRIEKTEQLTKKALNIIYDELHGEKNINISIAFVGQQPSSYAVNDIFLWTSGPQDASVIVQFDKRVKIRIDDLKERLRKRFAKELPNCLISFEPSDLISQIMSLGALTSVEIAITGRTLKDDKLFAKKLIPELSKLPYLRDLQFGQPLDYPTINININRELAGQLGVTVRDVSNSIVAATSSTRFTMPMFWLDRKSGHDYYVQLQIPLPMRTSIDDLQNIPSMIGGQARPLLGDIAKINNGKTVGEYDHVNGQRMVTLIANLHKKDLWHAAADIKKVIKSLGKPPRGVNIKLRGQVQVMTDTLKEMRNGFIIAIIVIFLMLTTNFESFKLAFISVSTVPAVICGVILMLLLTGTTLNIQSAMGSIMAIGIAVSNAILLTTITRQCRFSGKLSSVDAVIKGAELRIRPIIMTSLAMTMGMIPMAAGFGEGGEQTGPLGRAVIGGVVLATIANLLILPLIYSVIQEKYPIKSMSLDPDDPESSHYEGEING